MPRNRSPSGSRTASFIDAGSYEIMEPHHGGATIIRSLADFLLRLLIFSPCQRLSIFFPLAPNPQKIGILRARQPRARE
jgi:hypothetical protein